MATALAAVPWREALAGADRVLLKPNLGYDLPAPGATTAPAVLEAVVRYFVDHGLGVVIIEADQVLVDVERSARAAGVPDLVRRYGAQWVNLSKGRFERAVLEGARVLADVELPAILASAPLVTLPVMKTHAKTVVSGAIKNQWGLLPLDRHRYHPRVDEALLDLYRLAPPALTILDATVCMEGDGPKTGDPRRLDAIWASVDGFTLDCATTRHMGFGVDEVPHLSLIEEVLGPTSVELVGELPECAPFARPSHNLVSLLETVLRDSPVAPLVFDTPLFRVACTGARTWYGLRHRVLGVLQGPASGT